MSCCMENSVDPDQLASSEASWSGSTLFSFEFISGFILFFKEFMYGDQQSKGKLGSLCITCSLGQVKFSLDKYIMAIYLSLGKYKILLFPHLCSIKYHSWSWQQI